MTDLQAKSVKTTLVLMLKASLSLAVVALVGVVLLAGTWELTEDQIAEQRRKAVLASLNQILPADQYDNDIQDDILILNAQGFFHHPKPITVFRARRQGQPVALIMQMTSPDGYNGDIGLLVGIDTAGKIVGVRVTRHRETPGLGDSIDTRRSDWILGFNSHSLGNPTTKLWTVKRNGGYFDQFTGATISPRAVVKTVRRALEYERDHRTELYQPKVQADQAKQPVKEGTEK